METGLIIVKEDIFSKIRKNIFAAFFKKEYRLLEMMHELEKPRNFVAGKIVVPKEIKRK